MTLPPVVRFEHEGAPVFLEESHALPLVDFVIALRGGALLDPPGKGGLTRMTARLMRRGTKELKSHEVDEAFARLGGRLSVSISRSSVRLHGAVLARNLEPFVALVAQLVREPALRSDDLARAKRRILDELRMLREDDHGLADRHLRSLLFRDHAYGAPVGGTGASLRAIKRADVLEHHARMVRRGSLVLGASGAIDPATLERLVRTHFSGLPRGERVSTHVPAPKIPKGRRVLVVDKKDRSQTQLGLGMLGIKAHDPLYFPFVVADAAFGGTFTSRLVDEVRAKRGWSYGASSQITVAHQREAWRVWSHPSVENAVACTALELDLIEGFVAEGPKRSEVAQTKRFLANSRCFEEDTAARRLDLHMSTELFALDDAHVNGFRKAIRKVTRDAAHEAFAARIRPRDVAIVAVGSAKELAGPLGALPGVVDVKVVRHDASL
ncbi:MAG: insulinase family protein [Sandaracinus sp.]|nr:insulinase family protein [Sandaracinus sp.]